MQFEFDIQGGDFSSAGKASSDIKKVLKQLNIDPKIVRRIAVALYEAEVNVVAHAYKGVMKVDLDAQKIKIVLEDEGPGIENIEKAMQEGFSTATDEVRQMIRRRNGVTQHKAKYRRNVVDFRAGPRNKAGVYGKILKEKVDNRFQITENRF